MDQIFYIKARPSPIVEGEVSIVRCPPSPSVPGPSLRPNSPPTSTSPSSTNQTQAELQESIYEAKLESARAALKARHDAEINKMKIDYEQRLIDCKKQEIALTRDIHLVKKSYARLIKHCQCLI